MRFAALIALAGLFQADTGEQFYKFKTGTEWRFEGKSRDQKFRIVLKVVKEEDGKVFVDSKEQRGEEGEPKSSTLVWAVKDGFLTWHEEREGRPAKPVFTPYKLGAKKGDTWKSPTGDADREMDATHMGPQEVKVPAGVYPNAIHIRMTGGEGDRRMSFDLYMAPKAGVVKMEMKMGESGGVLELQEFKEGK